MHGGRRGEGQHTLRITLQEQPDATTLKLEGRVAGPSLVELNETWQKLLPSLGTKALVIDLQNVTFADAQGTELLRNIYRQSGNRFVANTPLTRHIAEQAINGKRGKDS